jgi:hypothetical protein
MANARNKTIDKTFLSIDQAEDRGFIHRDYIAHCLRWSHVCKRLYERSAYKTSRILDVGCGRELPLAKMLYSSRLIPQMYYGVDAGPINDDAHAKISAGKFPHELWENMNFLELTEADVDFIDGKIHYTDIKDQSLLPNTVTCFEVLEHVEPKMMIDMLEHMKSLTTDDAGFFISTPCWNRTDCAANHVNEMLYESLGACFERHGFIVENVYGTFASIRDYGHMLDREDYKSGVTEELFNRLREYYDTNFLSCIFAPLFPAQSRNCLWELSKQQGLDKVRGSKYRFSAIESIQQPWSSSARWEDMAL